MAGEDLRRQDDILLNDLATKVALLGQAQSLNDNNGTLRFAAIDKSFEAVNLKLDRILDGQSDPAASPAGRQLLEKIEDVRSDGVTTATIVSGHEEIINQTLGAVRMAKLAIGLAGLSTLSQLIALASNLLGSPRP